MSKVLLAIPRHFKEFYADGSKTGLFYVEGMHPYNVFKEAGYEVDIVSEDGNFGIDEHSVSEAFLGGEDRKIYENPESAFNLALKHVKSVDEVDAKDYKIAYAAAGHGALYYPQDPKLRALFLQVYKNNGVIAAVCHAPAIFEKLIDPETNEPFLKGKTITGFTDEGEVQAGAADDMKRLGLKTIKDIAETDGGKYVEPAGPWDDFTYTDGRLITGVNPQSAASLAKVAIEVSKK